VEKLLCQTLLVSGNVSVFLVKSQTSWPLPDESLRTVLGFLPNLRIELALRISSSVVLLIGTVPSGHVSPESLHTWKLSFSLSTLVWFFPLGLSGGSCKIQCLKLQTFNHLNHALFKVVLNSRTCSWINQS